MWASLYHITDFEDKGNRCEHEPHAAYHASSYRAQSLSRAWLFVTLWTVVHQSPLSIGFSRQEQEHWRVLPFPPLGVFLTQVSNTTLLLWQGDSLPLNYLECPPTVPWIMKAFTSNQKSLVSHWHLCIADLLVILQMKKSQILHSSWWINNYELIIINGTTSFTNIYKLISYRVNIWSQNFLTSNHQKKCKRVKREA